MKNILSEHIKRNMRENMGRTSLIRLSLGIVSIIVSLLLVVVTVSYSFLDSILFSSYESCTVSSNYGDISPEVVKILKNDYDVIALPSQDFGYIVSDDGIYKSVSLMGLNVEDAIKFREYSNLKKSVSSLNDNEIVIDKSCAKSFDKKENDIVEYTSRLGEIYQLRVAKVVDLSILGINMIVNESTYSQIVNNDNFEYKLISFKNKDNSPINIEKVDDIESKYNFSINKNTKNEMNTKFINVLNEYGRPILILLILIFTIIFVTLNSIVKIIINERIPVVGTFRSVGASKMEVAKILIKEMISYTIVPCIVGSCLGMAGFLSLGTLFNQAMQTVGIESKGLQVVFIVAIILANVVVVVSFQVLLSIIEIIKVYRLSIKECIFNKHTSLYKYSPLKTTIGVFLLIIGLIGIANSSITNYTYSLIGMIAVFVSIAFIAPTIIRGMSNLLEKNQQPINKIAINTSKRNSLQMNTNIIFIIVSSISLLAFSFFYFYITNDYKEINSVSSDIYASCVSEMSTDLPNYQDDFYTVDNVKEVSSIHIMMLDGDDLIIAGHKAKDLCLIYSDDYEKVAENTTIISVDDSEYNNLGKYDVFASNYYKDLYNLHEGDTITLEIVNEISDFKLNTPINIKIVGFVDLSTVANNSFIISKKLSTDILVSGLGYLKESRYYINLIDNSEQKATETRKRFIDELGFKEINGWGIYTNSKLLKEQKDSFKNSIKMAGAVILAIMLISLIGILNNQLVSFMERKKEFATLYSVAMSRKQIKDMILVENIFSFAIASLVSIVAYIILIIYVEQLLRVLFIPIHIKISIIGLALLLFMIAFVTLIIQLRVRKLVNKLNIVEEIKYE